MNLLQQLQSLIPFDRAIASGPDDKFLDRYRTLLFGHYRSLDLSKATNASAKAEAQAILAQDAMAAWEDLYRLEALILELEPLEALFRHVWLLRSEYQEICTPEEWQEYQASNPPDGVTGANATALLRADLGRLQQEINWHYIALWAFEEFREKIVKRLVLLTALTIVIVAALLTLEAECKEWWHFDLRVALPVLAAGWLGGLISTLRRVHSVKLSGNADEALTKLENSPWSIAVSPLLGSIFAGVLFFLFASTAIEGALFPKDISTWLTTHVDSPTRTWAEFSKLLIWSFIAGFMETFVPDKLRSLASPKEDS